MNYLHYELLYTKRIITNCLQYISITVTVLFKSLSTVYLGICFLLFLHDFLDIRFGKNYMLSAIIGRPRRSVYQTTHVQSITLNPASKRLLNTSDVSMYLYVHIKRSTPAGKNWPVMNSAIYFKCFCHLAL